MSNSGAKCTKCGALLGSRDLFCGACGTVGPSAVGRTTFVAAHWATNLIASGLLGSIAVVLSALLSSGAAAGALGSAAAREPAAQSDGSDDGEGDLLDELGNPCQVCDLDCDGAISRHEADVCDEGSAAPEPSVASAPPVTTVAAQPSVPPQVTLQHPTTFSASRFLDHEGHYPPGNAFDERNDTAWAVRDAHDGDFVEGCFSSARTIQDVRLTTGYERIRSTGDLFVLNAHLRSFSVELRDGDPAATATRSVEARSDERSRAVDFGGMRARCVRVVIHTVWPGSRWQDLSISEITVGVAGGEPVPSLAQDDVGFVDTEGGAGWGNRCFAHIRAGELDAAQAACDRGIAQATSAGVRGALLYNLGRIAEARGNSASAISYYRQSLSVRPGNHTVEERLHALGG